MVAIVGSDVLEKKKTCDGIGRRLWYDISSFVARVDDGMVPASKASKSGRRPSSGLQSSLLSALIEK